MIDIMTEKKIDEFLRAFNHFYINVDGGIIVGDKIESNPHTIAGGIYGVELIFTAGSKPTIKLSLSK